MCLNKLFSTEQKTKSSQSGTSNTESNYWDNPALQNFLSGYNSQFSGPSISGVQAPVNAWQTGAATNQAGLATGLGGAFNTANSVAANGIDPNRIQQFMSPYISSVVNPTMDAMNMQNQQALSNLRGNQASRGALGNNTGSEAAYMAGVTPGQTAAIGQLYNQGYGQAANLTTQDIQSRLAGAGQVGALTGVGSGANQSQFGMGETMRQADYQNQMTPFQLWNQGLQGQQLAGGLSGQNTQTTGQSTGTTTNTPGLGQSIMGIAGMGMGLFGGGGMFPMFGRRDGGAIPAYNSGGSVLPAFHGQQDDFASKVGKAFKAVQEMRRASGGRTEDKQDKGAGRFAEPRANAWSTSVKPYHSERLPIELASAIPPYSAPRPLVLDLPRYDGGGAVEPLGWGGFNANNSTEEAPSFGMNPFAQFPAPAGGEFPAQGLIPPFNPGAATTADVMEGYDPASAPSTQPAGGTRVASSAYRAPSTFDPSSFVPERATLEPVHPHQRAAAWMMAASGPSVLGPGGEAMLKQHQENLNKYRVETDAANQANALQQRLMQHQADMEHRREQLEHQQAVLAEQAQHHRAIEGARTQNRPETAYQVGMANAAVKDVTDRSAAIRNSTGQLERLGQMNTLINNENVRQGAWANWELEGKKMAQALGFNMQGVPESEALRALSNQIALQLRNPAGGEGMPGAMSDADRNFLVASVPGLTTTDAGNRALIRIMQDKENYRIRQNRAAIEYIQRRHTNDGLEQHMQQWAETNPMIRAETRREAEQVLDSTPQGSNPQVRPTAGDGNLPTMTPEQARQSPPGTRFRGTDGRVYKVPDTAPPTEDQIFGRAP